MSCYCDFEAPSFFNESWHKAKKEHKCCECGSVIAVGDEYQKSTGVWDGEFQTYKTCERCADLRDSLSEVSCPTFRGLQEEYWNYLESAFGKERANEITSNVFG